MFLVAMHTPELVIPCDVSVQRRVRSSDDDCIAAIPLWSPKLAGAITGASRACRLRFGRWQSVYA